MERLFKSLSLGFALLAWALPACEVAEDGEVDDCSGGVCDTPSGDAKTLCQARKNDALASDKNPHPFFIPTAIRWGCADVDKVNTTNQDDRGQEYCEYFAIIKVLEKDDAIIRGRDGVTDGNLDGVVTGANSMGPNGEERPDELSVALSTEQRQFISQNPDEIVGQCVFSSWHQDIPGPVPACERTQSCPKVLGVGIDEANFRMQGTVNSNGAAQDLVDRCMGTKGDAKPQKQNPRSDYMSGCMMDAKLFQTEWRKSDPTICATAAKLTECGCHLADNSNVAKALVPAPTKANGKTTVHLRGFPLGTWDGADKLPQGCEFVDLGDNSQTVVTCPIFGSDLKSLLVQKDPKGLCRSKYADNVVVHIPIPGEALTCDPEKKTLGGLLCGEQPWVVTN